MLFWLPPSLILYHLRIFFPPKVEVYETAEALLSAIDQVLVSSYYRLCSLVLFSDSLLEICEDDESFIFEVEDVNYLNVLLITCGLN